MFIEVPEHLVLGAVVGEVVSYGEGVAFLNTGFRLWLRFRLLIELVPRERGVCNGVRRA